MRISQNNFSNEIPGVSDHILPAGYARRAINCNTERGDLRAFKAPSRDSAISITTCQSLYQHTENSNNHWVVSATPRHYCKSPISGDQYERAYFTGETEARYFSNDNVSGGGFDPSTDYFKLGIPAPTTAPTVVTTGGGATYRGYVYSYVDQYGAEGPPSPIGSDDDWSSGPVTISDLEDAPAGRAITTARFYRTNSSATGTNEFQFVLNATWFSATESYVVGDFVLYDNGGGLVLYKCTTIHSGAWDGGHFTAGDDVADANLLTVFPKTDYDPPPTGLQNLIALQNGSFCGFVGNVVYFSEPFLPHAWPSDYQIALDTDITAMAADKNEITVAGDGNPYVLYGSHPSTMSRVRLSEKLPVFNIRGMVSGNGGRLYITKKGIIFNSGDIAQNIVDGLISDEEWNDYSHENLYLEWYETKLFVFDTVNETGFFVDFSMEKLSVVQLNKYFHATHIASDGDLYFIEDDTDSVDENDPPENMPLAVKLWEGSSVDYMLFNYQSREFILDRPVNMGAAYIVTDQDFYDDVLSLVDLVTINASTFAAGLTGSIGVDGPIGGGHEISGDEMVTLGSLDISTSITFKLYVDDQLRKTKTVNQVESYFRLPSGYLGRRIYFELSGYIPIKKISIAPTMDEL